MADHTVRPNEGQRVAVFMLTSFNLGLVALLVIVALHLGGGLGGALGGLNSLVGLALYAGAWGLVRWGVGRGLSPLDLTGVALPTWGDALEAGAKGGAVVALAVTAGLGVLVLGLGLLMLALGDEPRPSVAEAARGVGALTLAVIVYSTVGGFVASVIGALVGGALALIDRALLGVARRLEGGSASSD
jgi:hypothetical protein